MDFNAHKSMGVGQAAHIPQPLPCSRPLGLFRGVLGSCKCVACCLSAGVAGHEPRFLRGSVHVGSFRPPAASRAGDRDLMVCPPRGGGRQLRGSQDANYPSPTPTPQIPPPGSPPPNRPSRSHPPKPLLYPPPQSPLPEPPPQGASGQQLVGGLVGVQNRSPPPVGVPCWWDRTMLPLAGLSVKGKDALAHAHR